MNNAVWEIALTIVVAVLVWLALFSPDTLLQGCDWFFKGVRTVLGL
jgi:hypothetical protein